MRRKRGVAGQRVRWVRLAGPAAGAALVVLLAPGVARSQSLEEYDYENLGVRALGVEAVWVNAKDAKGTIGFGIRADLGYLGPNVRVAPRFAYWKADIEDGAVAKFERNLEALCTPPGCTINLGDLRRNAWVVGLDFEWIPADLMLAPYLGAGLELYVLDDSGEAIKGTFLDDAVVTAGVSAVGGLQLDLRRHLRLYSEVRGTLVTSASNVAVHAGVAYRF